MKRELVATAARQHGAVARDQTVSTKNTLRNAVDQGHLLPLSRRVFRAAGAPDGALPRLAAAVLDAGPHAALSHLSAAWLWRLPGFAPEPIHVLRPYGGTHRPSPLTVVHHSRRLPEHHLRSIDGLTVTSPARTLFDLAGAVHPKRLERAVDTALARQICELGALVALLDELTSPGRKGVRALRAVLADHVTGIDSELEARFRDLLRAHGLPQPERQVVLGDDAQRAGRVDCFFRDAGLVVELDGRPFHSSKLDRLEDGRRDLALLRSGKRVLRLTWHHVVERSDELAAALRVLLVPAA
jgi:very-short-patch-repair endonuclease